MVSIIKADTGMFTVYHNGKSFTIDPTHPRFVEINKALREGNIERALELNNLSDRIINYLRDPANPDSGIRVENGVVFYRGEKLHHNATSRIVDFLRCGLPPEPYICYVENLLQNTSRHSIYQLDQFMTEKSLPLTTDGYFVAYKRVQDNWTDFWTGKIDNRVGNIVEMPRWQVEDDWTIDCAPGLHAGSISYVEGYHGGQGHLVCVKINPKDVVSVPKGWTQKLRCCRYKVICEVKDQTLRNLPKPLYKVKDTEIMPAETFEFAEVALPQAVKVEVAPEPIFKVPVNLLLWCEQAGFSSEAFSQYFLNSNIKLREAWYKGDYPAFYSILKAVVTENHKLKSILDNNAESLWKLFV